MRIAILTSGILPVPATRGGAVENLVDLYLEYNDKYRLHDITIYSVADKATKRHPALKSEKNHYRYIKTTSLLAKLKKALLRQSTGYYNYAIEYYLQVVIRQLRQKKYDVIIVENRPGFILKLKEITNAKFVLHLHNDFLHRETKAANEIFDSFNCIVSVSGYITNRVKEIRPDNNKCKTVHNAIDNTCFHKAIPAERESIGISKDDFVIVYSGRLRKEKGILELIQAIKRIKDIPNLKLLIIGANAYGKNQQPTPFIEQIKKESESIKNLILFTGYIPYTQIPSYLKVADIAVVPSMWEEPFGLTVIEAMAAGLPLITTRSGGIPEICEGVATIVNREGIIDYLVNAILDLYEHPEKRQNMAAVSLERAKLFDKETYAKNFFKALEEGLQ